MQKKLVLRRNLRKGGGGGPPYLRYLVIAAVSLAFLVIITPYLVKQKGNEVNKRPVPEKGAITKELPKLPEQSAPARIAEPVESFQPPKSAETGPSETTVTPEPIRPPEVKSGAEPTELGPATAQRPPVEKSPPLQGKVSAADKAPSDQSAKFVEPAPRDLFPKQGTPTGALLTSTREGPAKAGVKAGAPALSRQKGEYAVQVGSVFTNKSQAQTDVKDLSAKGYRAVVRTAASGSGYIVTTDMVPQSMAYTLLEQMKMQGLKDTKVIKVAH